MKVRKILNRLTADALRRLITKRGLDEDGGLRAKRAKLSRSYRGVIEELVGDLLKSDFVLVFRREIPMENGYAVLADAEKYRLDELRSLATTILVRERIPKEFELIPYPSDEDEVSDADGRDLGDSYDPDSDDVAAHLQRLRAAGRKISRSQRA